MGFSAGGAVTMEATYKSTLKNQPNFIAPIYPWMHIVEKQKVPQNKLNVFLKIPILSSILKNKLKKG